MPRTADYTIQGFLYQFNKTALEILRSQDDDTITVEGINEDIEVISPASQTAIQCKYHGTKKSFTPSAIFKPLLQMLNHFIKAPTASINYILYAHFPGDVAMFPTVGKHTFNAALASKDKNLQKYIKLLPRNIDLDAFDAKFRMEFGPSYDELTVQVREGLVDNGLPADDIETLAYPNAIHIIATLSIKHDTNARRITKKHFLTCLKNIHTTAISRWTLALKTRKKLLETRRKQIKGHLAKNTRLRYFLIDPSSIKDYKEKIVLFITDYIHKYHFKLTHISTPILCLCATRNEIQEIQSRLYKKHIVTTDGYVGGHFEESFFFREPIISKEAGGKPKREFDLRIMGWWDHGKLLNNKKCDDLFIIGNIEYKGLDTVDVNIEEIAGVTMEEIKYLMGVSNVYE